MNKEIRKLQASPEGVDRGREDNFNDPGKINQASLELVFMYLNGLDKSTHTISLVWVVAFALTFTPIVQI